MAADDQQEGDGNSADEGALLVASIETALREYIKQMTNERRLQ